MNIKIESGANVQITDKPIVNVLGGDVVQNKEVHFHPEKEKQETEEKTTSPSHPVGNHQVRDEEQFHFVHPELDDEEAWRIHDAVKRVVRLQGIQMICQYLFGLKSEKKVLLPPNPSAAYKELVRMGMPNGEGFNETTFRKYYNKPGAPNDK